MAMETGDTMKMITTDDEMQSKADWMEWRQLVMIQVKTLCLQGDTDGEPAIAMLLWPDDRRPDILLSLNWKYTEIWSFHTGGGTDASCFALLSYRTCWN